MILARTDIVDGGADNFLAVADPVRSGVAPFAVVREQSVAARLITLETMGLARARRPHRWEVRRDLEVALKSMQRAADHQKTLAAHGALLSDRRLQLSAPNWRDITSLEGRVLSNGEEENGKRYLLLEGTNARVYYLHYTPELDEARRCGDLGTKSFIMIRKTIDADRRRRILVANLGDADSLLENEDHFTMLAKRLLQRGAIPLDTERWHGWLGRYHEKMREAILHLDGVSGPRRVRSTNLER
jgi:hypothetical protein